MYVFTITVDILFSFLTVTSGNCNNDLWSFNTSSGNWTWRGGNSAMVVNPLPSYPTQIGDVGRPGGIAFAGFVRQSTSVFIFGGYRIYGTFNFQLLLSFVVIAFFVKEPNMMTCGNMT